VQKAQSALVERGTPGLAAAPTSTADESAPVVPQPMLVFQLRRGEQTSWTALPETLHAFSLGRWECALSAATEHGDRAAGQLVRRLACTHGSGRTVQSQLGCAAHAAEPAELELTLDLEPTLYLRCSREERREPAQAARPSPV
jgi:hypothetical protein